MIRAVLLDMDGVLVDVRGSYHRAVTETVAAFTGRPPAPGALDARKAAGGFNNDWVLTHALVREAGHDVPFERVRDAFQARYLGADGDGLIAAEPAAVRDETLAELAARYRLAVVTGRPEADAAWTLRRFGWDAHVAAVVGMGRQAGREKPDPHGVRLALDELGVAPAEAALAGDSVDDMRAAVAAGVLAVGVVPPGADPDAHGRLLMGAGARVVVSTPDALPALFAALGDGPPPRVV